MKNELITAMLKNNANEAKSENIDDSMAHNYSWWPRPWNPVQLLHQRDSLPQKKYASAHVPNGTPIQGWSKHLWIHWLTFDRYVWRVWKTSRASRGLHFFKRSFTVAIKIVGLRYLCCESFMFQSGILECLPTHLSCQQATLHDAARGGDGIGPRMS